MSLRYRIVPACLLACASIVPALGASALAAPLILTLDQSFAAAPYSIAIDGNSFTFSATGSIFNPIAVQTGGAAAVSAFGGFLGIPLTPSPSFTNRGTVTYGPGFGQFASFTTPTTISASNGNSFLGLRATLNGSTFYGFAAFTNATLNSIGFESLPGTAITAVAPVTPVTGAVPEAATWAMMLVGFGAIGGMLRRPRATVRFA